jgi:hypothetical protein
LLVVVVQPAVVNKAKNEGSGVAAILNPVAGYRLVLVLFPSSFPRPLLLIIAFRWMQRGFGTQRCEAQKPSQGEFASHSQGKALVL